MRRISTTTRNRKREKDRDRRRKSKAEISVDAVLQSSVFDPFQLTTCSICGGIEDEDLIILCDGPGCTNEIHMYCMTPLMTKVPEGDWFCEACDKSGTTTALKKYFTDFASTTNDLKPPSPHGYLEYIIMLQQRHVPLDEWKPNAEDFHVVCEFNPSSPDLIGGLLRLSINESQRHTGRIINRRFDKVYERWEHLVQFKRYDAHFVSCHILTGHTLFSQWDGRQERAAHAMALPGRTRLSGGRHGEMGAHSRLPLVARSGVLPVRNGENRPQVQR